MMDDAKLIDLLRQLQGTGLSLAQKLQLIAKELQLRLQVS
jgi:hypothetical protein